MSTYVKILITSLIALSLVSCTPAHEVTVNEMSKPFAWENGYKDTPAVSIKQSITVDGKTYQLLPTFDDTRAAIEWLKAQVPKSLTLIKEFYPWLGELSDNNWAQYQESMTKLLNREECPEWFSEDSSGVSTLRSFFDICENQKLNAELIERAKREGAEGIAASLTEPA